MLDVPPVSELELEAERNARDILLTHTGKQVAKALGDPEAVKLLLRLAYKRGYRRARCIGTDSSEHLYAGE